MGKTYLIKKFAIQDYPKSLYIKCTQEKDSIEYEFLNIENSKKDNTENDEKSLKQQLKKAKLTKKENIIDFIKKIVNESENKILVIIDDIQENTEFIEQLKNINCQEENIDLIIITSSWGITLKETSLESKNIESITLKPLNYTEFLNAIGEEELANRLKKIKIQEIKETKEIEEIQELKSKYINNLKKYIYIGGMPEVVLNFCKNKNYLEVRSIQEKIINEYKKQLEKKAPSLILGEIKSTLKNIPIQLKKEDKRFVCKEIEKFAQDWQYESAINWLIDTGIIYKVPKITKPEIPIAVYQESTHYRLFLLDIGILSAMIKLDLKIILESNEIFNINNMQLSNQFIYQELTNKITTTIYYWQEEKYLYNIDFIIQNQGKIYSFKMDTINKENDKDLWIYHYKYKLYNCFRITISQFEEKGWNIISPLYLI